MYGKRGGGVGGGGGREEEIEWLGKDGGYGGEGIEGIVGEGSGGRCEGEDRVGDFVWNYDWGVGWDKEVEDNEWDG